MRQGHKLDVWLSDAAWLKLNQRAESTLRAKVEAALAEAGQPLVVEVELNKAAVQGWIRTCEEEDLRKVWVTLRKRAETLGITLQR